MRYERSRRGDRRRHSTQIENPPGEGYGSPQARPPRVLYWGVHDETYPRNARIRAYLSDNLGAVVDVVPKPTPGSRFSRIRAQLRTAFRARKDYSAVILSEFSIQYAFASWIAARRSRSPHIVDFFVGLHETEVGDLRHHHHLSPRAMVLRAADGFAARSAVMCLTDTQFRAEGFQTQYGRPFLSLPVGAPEWVVSSRGIPPAIDLLYYGSYLPLHGVDLLLRSIALRPSAFRRVVMVGSGPLRQEAESLASELGLRETVEFVDPVTPETLSLMLASARVTSGVLGGSEKASSVIANKVWQSLYAGVPVVTRSSEALSELPLEASSLLFTVDHLSPNAVAEALDAAITSAHRGNNLSTSLEAYVGDRYARFGALIQGSNSTAEIA